MKEKVLFLYTYHPVEVVNRRAALGSYLFSLAGVFHKNNYEVCINGISYESILEKISLFAEKDPGWKRMAAKMLPLRIKETLKDLKLFVDMGKLYKRIKTFLPFDCIVEAYSYAGSIGFELSKNFSIPLIVDYDSPVTEQYTYFVGHPPFFKSIIENREKNTLVTAKKILVNSNAMKKHLSDKYPVTASKIHVQQHVDFSRFEFFESKPLVQSVNIGFIGSFIKWHRVEMLLEAFEKLRYENFNLKLFLLGYGLEFNSIMNLVSKSPFTKDIIIPGFVDGAELLQFKKNIHIGVIPGTTWYCAPNKIFECGAAKMAVVAPATPTISDLFTDKEILFFQDGSADGLYLSLKKLCASNELINSYAEELQRKIRTKYSENNTFRFYKELIDASKQNNA